MNQKAIFAAGCFWGVEDVFAQVEGVENTIVGYIGGHTQNPSYEEVCKGDTGHAEAVEIEFNSEQITYEQLLDVFFTIHNPTTKNAQGPDVGTQYRSAIFYLDEVQKEKAEASVVKHQAFHKDLIVSEVTLAGEFYQAEEYHQKYFKKNSSASCHLKF